MEVSPRIGLMIVESGKTKRKLTTVVATRAFFSYTHCARMTIVVRKSNTVSKM